MGNCSGSQDTGSSVIASAIGVSRNYSYGGRGRQSPPVAGSSTRISAGSVIDLTREKSATRSLKIYSFNDLKIASRNFSPLLVVGVGGFGTVYRGWVDEKTLMPSSKLGTGIMVAIKKLNPKSSQGFEEWQSEVNFLGMLSHPNLVKLLGFCWEQRELILVYEYVEKGSLEDHLFKRSAGREPLSWDLRLKIAIGAARGLAFLHNSGMEVIYRDFKTSNILLDESYNAKISDFGLARLGPSGSDTHVTTRVMGTLGYAAPEYISTGRLSVKSDVYGFGVVLLEIITGLKSLDHRRPREKQNLVDWMRPLLQQKRKLKFIIDEQIEGQYSSKAAFETAQLSLRCLEMDPKKRPAMSDIVECLESIAVKHSKNQPSSYSSFLSHRPHFSPPYQNHRSYQPGTAT